MTTQLLDRQAELTAIADALTGAQAGNGTLLVLEGGGLDLALAERAHTELVASGAQPRRLRETGPDALTPAERRVAGMAAEGMTNRAIAQGLFVSEKTVETQLRSVYRKLDLGSRSQLPDALAAAAT